MNSSFVIREASFVSERIVTNSVDHCSIPFSLPRVTLDASPFRLRASRFTEQS